MVTGPMVMQAHSETNMCWCAKPCASCGHRRVGVSLPCTSLVDMPRVVAQNNIRVSGT
jgi:hypothetical protein